ncbi:MAG TPA: NAD(P)H-dependent oxidoreductase subunit E, partial [Desulfobacterales bacterium]|nr:NAD(P)H-dependent oxidoreductase subunit E [Desulfobacterales bacterium]
ETLKQELGVEVGGTTADGQYSLEVARCFGACGLAPTIMIDEEVHQRVKPLKLRAILAQYANGKAAAKQPAAKRPAVGAAARPRGRPGSTTKRSATRKPAARKPAAKKGAAR